MKIIIYVLLVGLFVMGGTSCSETENKTNTPVKEAVVETETVPKVDYVAKGKEIAQGTFNALSGKLKKEMMAGGSIQALSFCDANALSLTDSLSQVYNAEIRRVATDYRNPKNMAMGYDMNVFLDYTEKLNQNEKLIPQLYNNEEGQTVFYAPILLKGQCLACHGGPGKHIDETTLATINKLYPDDHATGFAEGDLRGVWKITFNN